jgi:ABC-2 type transport system permease protein
MKLLFKIAKNELRYLFYSPIAWFVMIVFWVVCAAFYINALYPIAWQQDIYLKNSPGFNGLGESLTARIFQKQGVFDNVINNLYYFIPILTMGLISREVTSNSVKLLYSSPVSIRKIVLGKYLGIVLYNLLLVAILGVFMVSGVFNIRHADYGLFLSAALGFYLLVCAYSSIGLFMSTLSTYQLLSALGTFIIIFLLGVIGKLWQRYDFVRDLTWWLSLQSRTAKMLNGLIVTRDVIYFIIVSGMFLAFSVIKLQSGRQAIVWYVKMGKYLATVFIVVVLTYTSSRPAITGYLDTTATQRNTIPKRMQKIIREFGDSSLEITLYTNFLTGMNPLGAATEIGHCLPEARNADYMAGMWEKYQRFKPDMEFKYEYYYDNDAKATDSGYYKSFPGKNLEQMAAEVAGLYDIDASMYKTPEQMHKIIDLQPEGYKAVMGLKYGGRTEFLRTFPDNQFWPDYLQVAAACKRLLHPEKIPKVYFVTGELERSSFKTGEREYAGYTRIKLARSALVNIGFDVDTLNLQTADIPASIAVLVLADPKMDLPPVVQNKLSMYIAKGGNMVIMGEPGKQDVLNPFLRQVGVQLMSGQLVEPNSDETPDKVYAIVSPAIRELSSEIQVNPAALMPGATALSCTTDSGFAIEPLLQTIPNMTWLKAGDVVVDSTLPPFNEKEGDVKENFFNTSVKLTRQINNKQQRIIICGDADFASNQRIGANYLFLLAGYSWMADNEFPIMMQTIAPDDTTLKITVDDADNLKIIYVWVLPGIFLALGAVLLIRRKRK